MAGLTSVYVIASAPDCHKIGIAYDPAKRLRSLNGASPVPLTLVASSPSEEARKVEAMAHWLLRDSHLQGEWFRVSQERALAALAEAAEAVAAGDEPGPRVAGAGRPRGNAKPTHVRLPPEAMRQIDEIVGKYGRAQFIREAIEEELDRRERLSKPKP